MKYILIFVAAFIATVAAGPLLPLPKPETRIKLYYYPTPNEQTELVYNSTESLVKANLKPNTKTIFLLDGFMSFLTTPMNQETKNLFSGRPDVNVIIVDWKEYSGHRVRWDSPEQIAALYAVVLLGEIPKMAVELADFVHFVGENSNISYNDMTLIGLSMGCHAAGQTGRAFKAKYNQTVGRIVAEDTPHQFVSFEVPFRLQQGDADVVEAYITDRNGLGDMNHPVGDVTIFVNGGAHQPCDPDAPLPPGAVFPCGSHVYSFKLYNYLDSNSTVKACPCRGAACLCQGCSFECGEDGISVGPHIPKNARGTYHLNTGFLDWST